MKKFLTLLFAFTCLAFSEMRGQVTFGTYSSNFGFSNREMTSTDGVNYSWSGTIPVGSSYNPSGWFAHSVGPDNNGNQITIYKVIYYFPKGTAIEENYGNSSVIVPGDYLVRYNKLTHEYSFTSRNYQTFYDCGILISSCNKFSVYLSAAFSSFQWKLNGEVIPGATNSDYIHPSSLPEGNYSYSCDAFSIDSGAIISSNTITHSPAISVSAQFQSAGDYCSNRQFKAKINEPESGWVFKWKKDGQYIPGANQGTYNAPPQQQITNYSCVATCSNNNASKESNAISVPACFGDSSSAINYLLVQNVTTTGNNASNKTTQVQFDLSWGNTWWDDINWDAAWVFMKYKTASGEWKHAKINPTGYDKGQGSPSIIQPTADKMGAFVRLGQKGQGNFNAEGMQLQWNYGLDGLTSVNGLEVKVFGIEMVYQPQGDFTLSTDFSPGAISAPAGNIAVVNNRLSPVLTGNFKIKGDAGLDLNADGALDNTSFPTGYKPFYLFKYEMSEQAYADFLNCLSASQVSNLGIAGTSISLSQGQYFAAAPNRACNGANATNLFAIADWSGLRPLSFFELHKAWNGPHPPNKNSGKCGGCGIYIPDDANGKRGAGFFGGKDIAGNVGEPFIEIFSTQFTSSNGDGQLESDGNSNHNGWLPDRLSWGNFNTPVDEPYGTPGLERGFGFRLCRSAE